MSHDLWLQAAAESLSEQQFHQLHQFINLLLEANQRMNLTRIRSREDAEYSHVADALTLLRHIPSKIPRRAFAKPPGKLHIADIGSGGGVPGIILAICRPDAHISLIEATGKKAAFLKSACQQLQLTNVEILPVRAEDAALTLRDTQNIVTARAVAELAFLVEWAMPMLKIGGKLLAMKGPKITLEIPIARQALRICGGSDPIIHPSHLPSPPQPLTPTTPETPTAPETTLSLSDPIPTPTLSPQPAPHFPDPPSSPVLTPESSTPETQTTTDPTATPEPDAALPLPNGHVVVEVKKSRPTPDKYPRQPSAAKSKPL